MIPARLTCSCVDPWSSHRSDYVTGTTDRNYDVAQDGQRFLMITASGGAEDTSAPLSLIVVQNWHEELRRLVPTN